GVCRPEGGQDCGAGPGCGAGGGTGAVQDGGNPARAPPAGGRALAEPGARLGGDAYLGHGGTPLESRPVLPKFSRRPSAPCPPERYGAITTNFGPLPTPMSRPAGQRPPDEMSGGYRTISPRS